MIPRETAKIIGKLRKQFPVITLTGPRQSGKTTLLKSIYTDIPYVSLEDIDVRNAALNDPRGFLSNFPEGAVLDEIQRTPELFSYLQDIVDKNKKIHFVLSGSQNFLLLENISQSLAGRAGQVINLNSLATDAGISPNTAKSWLSILEASFIIYFLEPYYANFNKRIIKSPKLYFYDTGLVCALLGINSENQVRTYHLKGALFENLIITDLVKSKLHKGVNPRFFFWQNKTKQEIDLIIDNPQGPVPFEIKSGMTMNEYYFTNLKYWQKLTGEKPENMSVIYGGDTNLKTSSGNYISWKKLIDLNI
ncbi:MAG: ATP-binding protein [Bacteroidales bacterium]|jgi:predicted AAA+ superfamily ATPase|nr:ATP-binding protein [Bacteroidales bacterium]